MRIISSFHDFYDCVQATGQDLELRYIRKSREVDIPDCPFPVVPDRWWGWHKLRPESLVVGFCGKIYPIVRIPAYITGLLHMVYCFSPKEVERYVTENMKKKDIAEYLKPLPKRRQWQHVAANTRESIRRFFARVAEKQDRYGEFFEKVEAPIFLADSRNWRIRPRVARIIDVNPCLREVEFYRMIDPYTAFQELAMYLGAQAQPERAIPHVPDKVMVEAKGFDKYSFRRAPQKKK